MTATCEDKDLQIAYPRNRTRLPTDLDTWAVEGRSSCTSRRSCLVGLACSPWWIRRSCSTKNEDTEEMKDRMRKRTPWRKWTNEPGQERKENRGRAKPG